MRFIKNNHIANVIYSSGITYPVPPTINYFWNFGSISLLCLGLQVFTGIFLAMYYTGHVDLAFDSVEHIMRDISGGWLLRYAHANGASLFFVFVYAHIFRGLFYGSYLSPRDKLWFSGIIILFIMMGTAFMGYVLPWGQMSFWAATVITNLASAIPIIGNDIVVWLWGGFSVDNATLNRFFSLHYLLPFVILGLVFLHLFFLHEVGSSNPLGLNSIKIDSIPFTPYFTIKDLFGLVIFIIFFSYFIFFNPNLLGHPDNYIPANPLVTPTHIVPEWYFLPFYAILRCIPNKLIGVIALVASILILLLLPLITRNFKVRTSSFTPLRKFVFWFFLSDCILLAWLGGNVAEEPYITMSTYLTLFYFFYLTFFLFFFNKIDEFIIRISIKNNEKKN